MTLQLRPTFSESWYRVAGLRVKLRAGAQISRQYYRGERWYVVRDPAGNQFHRLSDAAYRFVGLLDGSRTVAEAWDLTGGQLADDAPTQPEVIQILSHLYSANLVDADVTPDATVLLKRHKKLQGRKMKGRMMNVMFPRIPLWDPDRFLVRWMPVVRHLFSRLGAVLWLIVVVAAVAKIAPMGPELAEAARNSISPSNWLWLWAVFVFVKLIHELGHAFACRRFGGECHELGIMFLVFIPTPYVDASTAWAFPSKWKRMFVGCAGMIVEIFFAALCAFFWADTNPNSLWNQLAFNAMLVAGVSTVVFNANPLLRYDGYYILSDWLEIPNLRQKSSDYTLGLIKRHVFRVKANQPLPPPVQRVWLFLYAVTSSIYRVFIGFAIMLLVAFEIPILGALMAIGGLITWLVVPVVKVFKYLTIEPELHRKRGRAAGFTLAFAGAVVVLIGLVPFWVDVEAVGMVEPVKGNKEVLRAGGDGFVTEVKARDGQYVRGPVKDASGKVVTPGDVILVAEDRNLEAEIKMYAARRQGVLARIVQARALDASVVAIEKENLDIINKKLADLAERKGKLVVRAPIDGQVVAPNLHELAGRYLPIGEAFGMVTVADTLVVRAAVEQRDIEPVLAKAEPNTEVRMAGDVLRTLPAVDLYRLPAATRDIDPSLTHAGGENIAPDPTDPEGRKSSTSQFEVGVTVANPGGHYHPGQRAYVRFRLDKKPLIWQWGRRFWQLIQTKSNSQWM